MFQNEEGVRLPLRQLADIEQTSGRYNLPHEGTRRRQTVGCNVRGRDLSSFVEEVRRTVDARVNLPSGNYVAVGGASQARSAAQREILTYSLIAGAGILMLLSVVFRGI